MIILDTNVLSALMRGPADATALAWLDRQPAESVWTTSITVMEVRFGLEILPDGRRRQLLESAFARAIEEDLDGRVLSFDPSAAEAAGVIVARRRLAGRPMEIRDAQIAGIASARRATVATRNTRDFAETGIGLVNPWG